MYLRRGQLPILIVNLIYLLIFAAIFSFKKNYEFIIYVGVIAFFFALILYTNKKVKYPNVILWGLTLWGFMHMAGGGITLENGSVLYTLILIPISKTYGIFRYDQLVHIIGFGVATLVMYSLLQSLLHPAKKERVALSIVVMMAGFGVGALNEMVEFIATIILPETGVGGYINTSLDLVSDFIGAIIALVYIRAKDWKI